MGSLSRRREDNVGASALDHPVAGDPIATLTIADGDFHALALPGSCVEVDVSVGTAAAYLVPSISTDDPAAGGCLYATGVHRGIKTWGMRYLLCKGDGAVINVSPFVAIK
jgi:hypothetical protein